VTYAPHEAAVARETLEIAFLVAVQHLPPRERAGLILRDAAGFSARETAKPLGTSLPAVNSAVQRGRKRARDRLPSPRSCAPTRGSRSRRARSGTTASTRSAAPATSTPLPASTCSSSLPPTCSPHSPFTCARRASRATVGSPSRRCAWRFQRGRDHREGGPMKVGTEQKWQAARKQLLALEGELQEHAERVAQQRRELPWVPVEKEYRFATEDGPKSLPDLFESRSQLLIYHLMFGEDWEVACPGCSSVADGLSGTIVHLNDRDVTLLCMSQAPLEKLAAYKAQRGWTVPWVSAYGSDFLFDYGFAFRREEMSSVVRDEFDMGQLLREAPPGLRDYREQVGASDLESAVSVSAGWSVFATRDGAIYNTYRVYPPSRLVTPLFSGLLGLLPTD
jgi:predicted dithiol-disulfide oxidoreductase (DUF899 family)